MKFLDKAYLVKLFTYGFVGVIGTAIHFSTLALLVEWFDQDPVFSSSVGFVLTVIVSFYLNKKYTFRVQAGKTSSKFLKYVIVSSSGFVLNGLIMFLAVDVLSWHYFIGQSIVVVVLPVSNFLLNNYWTFR